MKTITLENHINGLAEQYGSLRAAARELRIDVGYLSRLASGEKKDPSPKVLRQLGLARVVLYHVKPSVSMDEAHPIQSIPRSDFYGAQIRAAYEAKV